MSDKIRVIIAGGRDFDDYALLRKTVDKFVAERQKDIVVVCGKAKGADTLGEQYAKEHGYEVTYFPADWKKFGKRAGFIRNEEMAKNADALIAFWDGQSHGTANMIDLAKRYVLDIVVKHYHKEEV